MNNVKNPRNQYIESRYPDYTTICCITSETGRSRKHLFQACRTNKIECKKVYTPYASGVDKLTWIIPKRFISFYNNNMLVIEASVILGLSRQRVFVLCKSKRLPCVKSGGVSFINIRSVIAKALEKADIHTIIDRINKYIEKEEAKNYKSEKHHFLRDNVLVYLRKHVKDIEKAYKNTDNLLKGCICHRLTTLP